MKKLLLTTMSVLAVGSCLMLGSCGEKGTYKFEKAVYKDSYSGDTHTINVGDINNGIKTNKDSMILIVEGDTAILRMSTDYEEEDATDTTKAYIGTWVDGIDNEIYFYFEYLEETIVAKKDGRTLTFELNGITCTLKK